MKKKEVIFRVDGSMNKGIGHLMRCLSIADKLMESNIISTFFSHPSPLEVAIISGYSHRVFYQRGYAGEITISRRIEDYTRDNSPDCLVIDLPPDLSENEALCYQNVDVPTLILDDHGPGKNQFEVVINSIAHPDQEDDSASKKPAQIHDGPDYIILPEGKKTSGKKTWSADSNKVLIAMGGSDPHNITIKALNAFASLKTGLEIHLLLGPGYSWKGSIEEVRKNVFQPLFLHSDIKEEELSSFLTKFRFAIISFGLTVYSAARIGLPVLVLAHNKDGKKAASAFVEKYETGFFAGLHSEVTEVEIADAAKLFLEDKESLKAYSQAGKKAVDGNGLKRVTDIIKSLIS